MEDFDIHVVFHSIPYLAEGMLLTFKLTIYGIGGGLALGTVLALARLSTFKPLSFAAGTYVNFFRSMPLILVIFWFYFLLPMAIGQDLGAMFSVVTAFVLFEAAYYCEIMRAGIQSVRAGQPAAGSALGLTYAQNMRYIVLPQAFRAMMPILLNQAIILFQDTSLVYVVGLGDFLVHADIVANRDNRLLEMYITAAIVYFAFCLFGQMQIVKLQRKYAT